MKYSEALIKQQKRGTLMMYMSIIQMVIGAAITVLGLLGYGEKTLGCLILGVGFIAIGSSSCFKAKNLLTSSYLGVVKYR